MSTPEQLSNDNEEKRAEQRKQVLALIDAKGCACLGLVMFRLEMCQSAASGRLSELRESGDIKRVGTHVWAGHKQAIWKRGDDRALVRQQQIVKLHRAAEKLGYRAVRIEEPGA